MSKFAAALALGVASTEAGGLQPNYSMMWSDFLQQWPKVYAAGEDEKRFEIFKMNVDKIYEENAKGHSHRLGVTAFADLTTKEFTSTHFGYKPELRKANLGAVPWVAPSAAAPTSIDWVAKGAVTPVKNQGQCGSCWAFSTTGALEGAYSVASGKLVSLSEEDLVQCDHNGDQGCQGGLMDNAFTWIQQNGGISSEGSYPYSSGSGTTGTCKAGSSSVVTLSGHTDVPSNDEDALKAAVAQQPVSVAIEADKSAFQLYAGGVLDSSACGTALDHGVLVVGYGTDGGKDYWKVKNSWGASWGEQGYIRMARGKNMCGIALEPSYPTGAKTAGATDGSELATCSGSADPIAATCYEGKAGLFGVTETVKVNLKQYSSGAGSMDLAGSGIKGFTCADHAFTKSAQDINVDLSDCLPSGVTVSAVKYCSDADTIAVTVVDAGIPITATLNKITCTQAQPNYAKMWSDFLKRWPKVYAAGEDEKRFEIFKLNVDKIYAENAKGNSHQLGVTAFADLTKEEFASTHFGYKPELRKKNLGSVPWVAPSTAAPTSIDWVAKGAVTPVKDQGQCGSCWAFSTTGAIEGAYSVASGSLVSLSEEDLVQCDHNGDQGCQGGLMDNAFTWIQQNGGITSEGSYPYTSGSGSTGTCKTGSSPVVTVSGHTDVPSKDEDALKAAVALQPVSVAIEADKSAFQLYSGGVLDSTACGTQLDHGVLVVGYGTDGGKDYWKVKNSWGASWGEQGYIRMVRGKNMCGIAMEPSYPTGAKAAGTSTIVV